MSGQLHISPCSYRMAREAVGRWHYSRRLPPTRYSYGVHENGRFIGAVAFGIGAASNIGVQFGLKQDVGSVEVMELVRVALDRHVTPVSRIVSIAIKNLRRMVPTLRLLVSYADTKQGHHGGIYQAGGWFYLGVSVDRKYRVHGRVVHPKTLHIRYGVGGQSVPWLRANVDPNAASLPQKPKHKYALPLDAEMRAIIAPLAKPYPKRAESIVADASANQVEEGGSIPTSALDLFEGVA